MTAHTTQLASELTFSNTKNLAIARSEVSGTTQSSRARDQHTKISETQSQLDSMERAPGADVNAVDIKAPAVDNGYEQIVKPSLTHYVIEIRA